MAQNVWGLRYIDDLAGRRVQHGMPGTTYTPPDGAWSHADISLTLSDSMFSVRRIIGDDWASPSHSVWLREREDQRCMLGWSPFVVDGIDATIVA